MDAKILASILLLVEQRVENALNSRVSSLRQKRAKKGDKGEPGEPGESFSFEKHGEELKNLILDLCPKFSDLTEEEKQSLRGEPGKEGPPGKAFSMEEHGETIQTWIKDLSLKFSDLTDDEKESLRGPRGQRGKNGRNGRDGEPGKDGKDGLDGKDFSMEEHKESIQAWIKEHAPKFQDLSPEEVASLRGARGQRGKAGRDGKDGESFDFSKHESTIKSWVKEFSLKFSDLSEEEVESLRGPKGKDGKDGKNFSFSEHEEKIGELVKASVDEARDDLRLKFSHLSSEEKEEIKLKFSDLGPEDLEAIRGPRGQRGKRGKDGKDGLSIRGLPGLPGPVGRSGTNGKDGEPGKDAPYITDIRIEEIGNDFYLVFLFSDNTFIKTNKVSRPVAKIIETYIVGGGGGGSGGGNNSIIISDGDESFGLKKEIQFGDDFIVTIDGDKAIIAAKNPNVLLGYTCDEDVYVGALVHLYKGQALVNMNEWDPIAIANPIAYYEYFPQAGLAIASVDEKSRPIGICIAKPTVNSCNILTVGPTAPLYSLLDMGQDYFLSPTVAGGFVSEADLVLNPGDWRVRIGQPVSEEAMMYLRGDRTQV